MDSFTCFLSAAQEHYCCLICAKIASFQYMYAENLLVSHIPWIYSFFSFSFPAVTIHSSNSFATSFSICNFAFTYIHPFSIALFQQIWRQLVCADGSFATVIAVTLNSSFLSLPFMRLFPPAFSREKGKKTMGGNII
ncbi:hypothetical protein ACJX0J_032510 [Zea mays]